MTETLFDFQAMPTLVTARLVLRPIRPEEDLTAIYSLFADYRVARYTDTGPFTSESDAAEVMDWIEQIYHDKTGMRWAITIRDNNDGMLVGTCGYNVWGRRNNVAEIGYDLAHEYWGRGLMTEGLTAMLEFGFRHMALHRIEADVTVGNEASARVLDKLGFLEEGLLRQRGYWRGEYHDLRFFGLLRSEWIPHPEIDPMRP